MPDRRRTGRELPRLTRHELARLRGENSPVLELPAAGFEQRPETILQLGFGNFVRGFLADFVQLAAARGADCGRIVAVQRHDDARSRHFEEQQGLYTLILRGASAAGPAETRRVLASVSRVLVAERQWSDVLVVGAAPTTQVIASNVTEAGMTFEAADRFDMLPPQGFAGRLTQLLHRRWRASGADIAVIPCELVEDNGRVTRELVTRQATHWKLEAEFSRWLERSVHFANTLVDRIVVGIPAAAQLEREWETLGYRDQLVNCAEPFHLFALAGDEFVRRALPVDRASSSVIYVSDLTPYRIRKLRLLNGPHTLLAALGVLLGLETVRAAVEDAQLGPFLRAAMLDELLPAVNLELSDAAANRRYAASILERFRNPSIEHKLRAISLNASTKIGIRLFPSVRGYLRQFGTPPKRVLLGIAAVLLVVRDPSIDDTHGDEIRERWQAVDFAADASLEGFARDLLNKVSKWTGGGGDLASLAPPVASALRALHQNPRAAVAGELS